MKLILSTGEKLDKGGLAKAAGAIPGGLAEKQGKTVKDFPSQAIAAGVKVEMEHTNDPKVAKEIALDHLTEDPKYYEKLEAMESGRCNKAMPKPGSKVSPKESPEDRKAGEQAMREAGLIEEDEEMGKAIYIGPRGGRWLDPQHTIPWKPEGAKKPATQKEEPKKEEKYRDLPGGLRAVVHQRADGTFGTTVIDQRTKEPIPGKSGKTAKEALDATEKKYRDWEAKQPKGAPKKVDSYSGKGAAFKTGDSLEVGGQAFEVVSIRQFEHAGETRHEVAVKKPKGEQVYHATIYGNGVWSSATGKGSTIQGTSGYKHKVSGKEAPAAEAKPEGAPPAGGGGLPGESFAAGDILDIGSEGGKWHRFKVVGEPVQKEVFGKKFWEMRLQKPKGQAEFYAKLNEGGTWEIWQGKNILGKPVVGLWSDSKHKKAEAGTTKPKDAPAAKTPPLATIKGVDIPTPSSALTGPWHRSVGGVTKDYQALAKFQKAAAKQLVALDKKGVDHHEAADFHDDFAVQVVGQPGKRTAVLPSLPHIAARKERAAMHQQLAEWHRMMADDPSFREKVYAAAGVKMKKSGIEEMDEFLEKAERSKQAPKEWWDKMTTQVRGNPKYKKFKEDRISAVVGSIWAGLDEDKKKEIRNRYGKEYGAAKENDMDKANDGKPGESLEETSTEELTETLDDIKARLKAKPDDPALQARMKAINAEMQKRNASKAGCATPGEKIRSGGAGRGMARGQGKGPMGVPIGKSMSSGIGGLDEYLEKAEGGGPYTGPRGGKWADPEHTIPWSEKRAQAGKKQAKPKEAADSDMADELKLYIDNDSKLYNQMFIPAVKNLVNKMASGKYDHAQATKLFNYLATEGANRYKKEHGTADMQINVATRMAAAKQLADDFHTEAKLGNYDEYLNKKNKKAVGSLAEKKGEKKEAPKKEGGGEGGGEKKEAPKKEEKKEGVGPSALPIVTQLRVLQQDPAEMSSSEKSELKELGFLKMNKMGNSVLTKEGKAAAKMKPEAYAAARRAVADLRVNKVDMMELPSSIVSDLRDMGWAKTNKNGNTVLSSTGISSLGATGAPELPVTEKSLEIENWLDAQTTEFEESLEKAYNGEFDDQYEQEEEMLAKAGEEGEELVKTYTAIRNAYEKEYGPGSWKKIKVSTESKESKAKPEQLPFGAKKKLGPEEHERYTEAKKRLAGKLGMPKEGWGLYGRTILGGLKDKKKKGEKTEKSMEAQILEEYLEKADQGMPTGNPKQGMGQGEEQGGKLDGVGKTGGSGDSDPGSPIGAPAPKKQKLSEDDAEDENQMKEHKKPIEQTAKSMAIPMNQRDMVAHENAVVVSKLRKGEDDVEAGTGIPAPAQAQSENLEKGRTWNQGADSRVFYSEQSDLECERLMKSDGEFYPMGSPKVTRDSLLIHQYVQCLQCKGLMAKSLAVCPHCGAGALSHRVTPITPPLTDAPEEIRKSRPGLLRPAKREADVFLPNGVTDDETE